jgi:hypothetical protein
VREAIIGSIMIIVTTTLVVKGNINKNKNKNKINSRCKARYCIDRGKKGEVKDKSGRK